MEYQIGLSYITAVIGVTETFMELYGKQVLTLFPGRQIQFSQKSPGNTNLEEKTNDLQK